MTEGQYKFQKLMEDQRHNLEMERLGQAEIPIKAKQAEADALRARITSDKEPFEEAAMVVNAIGNLIGGIGKGVGSFFG